jgi:predicted glycosyltransferase
MKFLFDLNHPAHVHFFRNPIAMLREKGHEILVTSRVKEMAVPLLDEMGIEHVTLSALKGNGVLGLARELLQRDAALLQVARRFRPNAMAAIGGTFVSHVGRLTGIPSLVFYDTENAKLQNAITYPFASRVIVPRCYSGWLPKGHTRYSGYHELSYLHPDYFVPDQTVAERNGYNAGRPNYFLRTVSWQANHDVFESGWTEALLRRLITWLSERGKVHVSSETNLPGDLARYAYKGKVSEVHHLLAYCRLFVGESATMASESAVLGVPAIYAANTGRGYTDEQENRYGLVKNLRQLDWDKLRVVIDAVLSEPRDTYLDRRKQLLAETVDVAAYVTELLEGAGRRAN